MSIFDSIVNLLEAHQSEFTSLEHPRVHTCDDAAQIRGTSPDQGAKALVCIADKQPILIVLPCSRKLDFRSFKQWQHTKDLRMATPEEVLQLTTLEIGAIPPIGKVFNLSTFVDQHLINQPEISFNAGLHHRSITMPTADYLAITEPQIGQFTISK